jgi:hypothetical protein
MASIKSEIGFIDPFLLSIHTLRSFKASLIYSRAPTNFTCGWILFTVVADLRRKYGIAPVSLFGVGTRLELPSILVLGGRTTATGVDLHPCEIPNIISDRIGRSDETSNPITSGSRIVT